jgi:cytoskeletal protein CcmA (bactofilin family)
MALFNKEPETNPEHAQELSPMQAPLTTPWAGHDVGPAHHASSTPREVGIARRRPVDLGTYLDSGTKISGKLSFEGPAQIDGQVEGEIVAGDHLVIDEGAHVTAKIKAGSVVVAGMVSGEIIATQRIEIRPSAKISGDLAAPRMVMHEGAMFEGHCTMKPEERRAEREPTVLRNQEQLKAGGAIRNGA